MKKQKMQELSENKEFLSGNFMRNTEMFAIK